MKKKLCKKRVLALVLSVSMIFASGDTYVLASQNDVYSVSDEDDLISEMLDNEELECEESTVEEKGDMKEDTEKSEEEQLKETEESEESEESDESDEQDNSDDEYVIDADEQEVSDAVEEGIDNRTDYEIAANRSVSVSGLEIVKEARKYVGKLKYVDTGTSLTTGADCSGFLCRIYEKFGINLWKYRASMYANRTSIGIDVGTNMDLAQAGDIVVYGAPPGKKNGHVGIVTERKTVINMQSSGCKEPSYKNIASWTGPLRCIIRPYGVSAGGESGNVPTYAAPTINNVSITDINLDNGTYQVVATVTAEAGLDRVQFPTWTEANGQDDLMSGWGTNTAASGTLTSLGNNQYSCRYIVRISDHKNEWGSYVTHVYAYDKQGQSVCYACNPVKLIAELKLKQEYMYNVNATRGYSVHVEVISRYEVTKIEFLVWTDTNGKDDLVVRQGSGLKREKNVADGTLYSDYYIVNVADHENQKDIYHNVIKVYENNGIVTEISLKDVDLRAASSGTCGDNLTWRLTGSGNDLSLYIEGTGDMPDNWLPDDVDQSRNIVPWYASKSNIKHVYLSEGITSIGSYAFSKTAITQIDIPDSVAVINDCAFLDCPGLSGTLELPAALKWIDNRAFLGTNYDTLVFHSTGVHAPKHDDYNELITTGQEGDFTAGFTPVREESGHREYCYYMENNNRTYFIYLDECHFVDETKVTLLYPADGANPTEYAQYYPWTTPEWNGYHTEPVAEDVTGFQLEQYSMELEESDQGKIKVILDAEDAASKTILWMSADENIATVDEQGVVTAVSMGNTIITAKVAGTTLAQECAIFVNAKPTAEIKLNVTSAVLSIGSTLPLTGEVLPITATNKKISWFSCDESIVTVDSDGLVKAVSAGSVSIVAQADDGHSYAYCDIKVLPSVDGIKLSKTDLTLNQGDRQTLFATVEPENASVGELLWSSADEHVATVVNGKVTAVGKGTTQITVKAESSPLIIAVCEVTVHEDTIIEEDKLMLGNDSIPQGIWIAGFEENMTYTGSAVKQEVRIYNGTDLLAMGKDYTLSYKNNVKAASSTDQKAPTMTITMKNNFSGKQVLKFSIHKADISQENFTADDMIITYNGKLQRPMPVLTYLGRKLKAKTDYVVSYPAVSTDAQTAYLDEGNYEIVIQGVGNYTGEKKVTLTITTKKPLNSAVIAKIPNQTYTGTKLEPKLKVTYKGIRGTLQEGIDYTVAYTENLEVGKAYVTINAIEGGNYIGSKSAVFQIVSEYSIGKAQITGLPKSVPYTGNEQEFTGYQLQYNGVLLKENEDYTVSYMKNKNVGTATVIFTGIKHYKGVLKKTFRITALQADAAFTVLDLGQVLYEKDGAKPKPSVTYQGQLLKEGVDYTLSYRNNKNVGEIQDISRQPMITIKGKGNFTGATSRTFTIIPQNIGKMTITVADRVYSTKSDGWKSIPVITDMNGKKLKAGTDYEKDIEYVTIDDWNDVPYVGTIVRVTVSGKGGYTGTISGSYHVMQQSVSSAKVVIDLQEYTGAAIEPSKENMKVTIGSGKNAVTLKNDDYDIIDYQSNIKKGTGYVLIRGKGNYGGTKKVSFKIGARSITKWWQNI